jgi:RNA binding exosome subunit
MKFIHSVELKAFLKEDTIEYEQKVTQFLSEKTSVAIKDFAKKEIIVKKEIIEGTEEFPENITTCFYAIRKSKLAEGLVKEIYPEIQKALSDLSLCIDENASAYVRFDKKEFLDTGCIKLVEHGECIHIKIKIAAYPSNKNNAIAIFKRFIDEMC